MVVNGLGEYLFLLRTKEKISYNLVHNARKSATK